MDHIEETKPADLGRYGSFGLGLGLILTVISIALFLAGGRDGAIMAQSYLFAWAFFIALTLGFFGFTLLHHTVRGKWGLPILRIFEAGGGIYTFGLMALLFIPVLLQMFGGRSPLYAWTIPSFVAEHPVVAHKAQYYLNMSPLGFPFRFVCFFLLWMGLSAGLRASTLRQDASGDYAEEQRRNNWAAPGLVAFFLSVTFAGTDWVMSLEPQWSSTMYGLWWAIGMGLAALSTTVIIITMNRHREPYAGLVTPSLTRDFGNLLLTLTMLWGYTSISQYLIIWSGNLPEYTSYFVNRSDGHWNAIGAVTIFGQFFIPFFLLITPRVKAVAPVLARVAGFILVMRLVDTYQLVMPAFHAGTRTSPMPYWQDFVPFLGIAGLWLWAFSTAIRRARLLPTYDARLAEMEAHAH